MPFEDDQLPRRRRGVASDARLSARVRARLQRDHRVPHCRRFTWCVRENWAIAQWPKEELPRRLGGDHGEVPVPLAVSAGLQYVYEGNVPGEGGERTFCPACRTVLVERYGFAVRENRIKNGGCPACGTRIAGVDMDGVNLRRFVA